MRLTFRLSIASAALALAGVAHAAPDGATLFQQQCAMCHALDSDPGKLGPPLRGVVGREAASAPGYAYSDALKRHAIRWTPKSLDRFLAAPGRVAPGTRMPLSVSDPAARAALIAYLKRQGDRRQAMRAPGAEGG